MGKVFRDRFNRADGALGSLPVGKSALAVIVGGGTHESYTASTYGWTVTTIDITTGGVWPSRATIATYDLLIIDAGYNGIDATGQTNAANAYTDGVSVYTTGNDTTAMSPLFTGSASDNAYDNNQYPNGTHALAAGWSVFGDGDLGIYLTGVNGSAVTFMTTQIAAGQWVATGVAMENALTGARWVHVQPYAATHPAGLDATVYGWLSETKWQTNKNIVNLISNPSFENTDLSPWGWANCTGARGTSGVVAGSYGFTLTPSGASVDSYAQISVTVTPGATYRFSGTITVPAAQTGTLDARARRLVGYSYDSGGALIAGYYISGQGATTGTTSLTGTFTMPANGVRIDLRLYNGASSGGGVVHWDAISLTEGTEDYGYFDGSTTDTTKYEYVWSGATHASTSIRREIPWMVLSGAFSITSNEITSSTAPGSNPLAVIDVGVRMNGKNDVDVSATPRHVYGNAVYVRVVDASNFVRARVQSWTNTYYVTEYLYNDMEWKDNYDARRLQREVRTTTTTYTYTYGAWSGWSNTGETTACRIDQPTYGLDPIVGAGGGNVTEYRWVSNGLGVGCAADKATYRKQLRTRTETQNTNYSYSYRWVDDGYVCGSNENFTGATQTVSAGPYIIWSANPEAATNPGKTTTAFGAYDVYVNTTLDARSSYWSTYAYDANDVNTGTTRQTGPYTDYYYGQVVLEKCVAGTFTQLGSYDSGSTAQQVLRLRAKDSTLQVYYGGTLRITATDAAHATTGTKVGVGGGASAYNATTPRLDDFSATLLTPYRVRNAADTAWINVERPKIRNAADTAWIDYDPKDY